MKLVTFEAQGLHGPERRLGALVDGNEHGRIVDLTAAYEAFLREETDEPTPAELAALRTPPDMIGWLRGQHKSREAAEQAIAFARRKIGSASDFRSVSGARLVFGRSDVRLLAPLPRPNTLRDFSIYEEHMSRAGTGYQKKPDWYRWPPYYTGNPDTIVGPEDPIPYPYYSEMMDLELEIGIVVGAHGRNLTFEQAKQAIAGYTILIDPSVRDPQFRDREPFAMGKRKHWCTVLGPCLVTADEVDEANMDVRLTVDGEVWFEGNTSAPRSFLAEHLVAYTSDNEPIFPGDVLGTGTVSWSCSMDTKRWPKVGQTVRFDVQGIGTLEHKIVTGEHVVDHVGSGMDGLLKA